MAQHPVETFPLRLKILLIRGLYGLVTSAIVTILSLHAYYESVLTGLLGSIAPYFTWTLIILLYIPTIAIVKALGASKKFELYLRGFSVYFVIFILTNIVIAS